MDKIIICKKCKKDSDSVILSFFPGDENKLEPGTKVGQWKCKRCRRIVPPSEKMFRVNANE